MMIAAPGVGLVPVGSKAAAEGEVVGTGVGVGVGVGAGVLPD